MTELKITQADRDAAATYGLDNGLIYSADFLSLTSGRRDDNGLIQAFARHRIAAEEGKAELVEALGRIAKCEPCHCMSCTHMGEMARQALTEWRDQ